MRIAAVRALLDGIAPALRGGALACGVALVLALAPPRHALAGGLELGPGGTASVMRGGAVAARPEDATAMLHNPAGIALLPDDSITFDLDFAQSNLCFDPYGYYGWGVYQRSNDSDFGDLLAVDDESDPTIGATYATTPLPKVCNSGTKIPIPNLAWVGKFGDDFAFGAGFVAPTLVTGTSFGGHDGTIDVDGTALPTPTRYMYIDQTVDASTISFAAAYRVLPALSLGVNVTLLGLTVKTRAIQNATSGTDPALDWLVDAETEDLFLPSVTFAAHVRPIRSLDATASLRWVDDFDGHGTVKYETNTYHATATTGDVPYRNDAIKLSKVRVGLPWAINVGVRYSGKLPGVPDDLDGKLGDPLGTELWDVEVDGTYNLNERAGDNRVEVGEEFRIITRTADGGGAVQPVKAEDVEAVNVKRHLEDSIALRLGGSYSIAPRKIALNAGVFYENRGIDPAYAAVDSFAFARVGFGVGAMFRLGDFDLMAAYGHIFQETVRLAPPPHSKTGFDQRVGGRFDAGGTREGGVVLEDPDAPAPEDADAVAALQQSSAVPKADPPPRVINAGEYTASFDIISVGAVYHF